MSWTTKAQTLIDTPFRPSCPAFETALRAVETGQFLEAAQALQALDGMQRFFASFVIELQADELGIDPDTLAKMCSYVDEIPTNSVDAFDIPHDMLQAWAQKVGIRLPVEVLMSRDKFCYGNSLLRSVVAAFCDRGEWETAAAFARRLNAYHREDVASLWARIGLGLLEGSLRNEALTIAAKAGDARPKIQEGGEEASAHGAAIEAFARGGLAHDHPAVLTSVKGLLKLANSKAQKSAPAWGTQKGIIAACLRAADQGDAHWRAIAAQLQATIWGSGLDASGNAAVLLADLRLGNVQRTPGTEPDQVLRAKAEGKWHKTGTPEEVAALREAGQDVEGRIQAFLAEWDGYGLKTVKQFVMGCRLRLPSERLEALLEAVPAQERAEALVEGASYGLKDDPRRLGYLERGYPEGDQFGNRTAHFLPLLTPEMLEKAEVFYGATGRVRALGVLAAWHLKQGRIAKAVDAISRFTQPESGKKAWVPRYRRGEAGRVVVPPTIAPATVPAAIKDATHAYDLLTLAQGLPKESQAWGQVMQAAHLKKWEKPQQSAPLVELRLLEGDVEAAIAFLPQIPEDRSRAEALRLVAKYLNRYRSLLPSTLEGQWSKTFLDILSVTHPQWATRAMKHVAEAIAAMSDATLQAAAMQRLLEIDGRIYRCEGDRAYIQSGFSRGFYAVGKLPQAIAAMAHSLKLASSDAIYLYASVIGEDLAAMREGWPRGEWLKMMQSAAELSVKHRRKDYEQLEELECITLALWKNGEVAAVNDILQNQLFPRTLRQDLSRSIWADIDLSPDPLVSLEGTWPKEPLPREVLAELMKALIHALNKVGHPEAVAVARLWQD